jgi:hypothetical protein
MEWKYGLSSEKGEENSKDVCGQRKVGKNLQERGFCRDP